MDVGRSWRLDWRMTCWTFKGCSVLRRENRILGLWETLLWAWGRFCAKPTGSHGGAVDRSASAPPLCPTEAPPLSPRRPPSTRPS